MDEVEKGVERSPVYQYPEERDAEPVESIGKLEKSTSIAMVAKAIVFSAELPMTLYVMASSILSPAQNAFIYWRICMYNYNSESLCQQIDTLPALAAEESTVQTGYASYSTVSSLCSYIPLTISAIILGSWCDRFSYRIPFILPHIGNALNTLLYLAFQYLVPYQAINPIYLGFASICSGIGGQTSVILMAVSSYATKTYKGQNLTVRLALVEAALGIGAMFGYFVSAFALSAADFKLAFWIQTMIDLYAVAYVFAIVPELHCWSEVKRRVVSDSNGSWLKFLFSPKESILSTVKIFFRQEQHHRYLLIMIGGYALAVFAGSPDPLSQVIYAFLTLRPISISPGTFAIFNAIFTSCSFFSLAFFIPLFRKHIPPYFPLSDAAMAMIGFASTIAAFFVLGAGGFYPEAAPWLYCVLGMLNPLIFISARSGLSKLSSKEEQGRTFSVICLCETLFGLVASLAFNSLYGTLATAQTPSDAAAFVLHGYTFFFAAAISCANFILFYWLARQPIKDWSFFKYANCN